MKLYRSSQGIYIAAGDSFFHIGDLSWDQLIAHDDLAALCQSLTEHTTPATDFAHAAILPPIQSQEVWAAGVTYFRSRSARIEESKDAGGGTFYDRVYAAERPEIFFKATSRRVVGHGDKVGIRSDAKWSVPEPELTLAINPKGKIIGYTVGNDMSSRDIEGENPLYLPQAKVYNRSCALGPCIHLSTDPLPSDTSIAIEIHRGSDVAFSGQTNLSELKRDPKVLVDFLFRDNDFPEGCFLMTGTGIVPPDSFTLAGGDRIHITIEPIGTLSNEVG